MEEQMRMLCSVWKDAWQGMVMAEIFWKEGTPKASCGVHVKAGRLIRLSACTDGGELSMVLLPFHAGEMSAEGTGGRAVAAVYGSGGASFQRCLGGS